MDFEKEMAGTIPVPEKDRLDEARLTHWMEANVAGYAGPLTMTRFKGGQSNPTYRLDTPTCSYVLRRQPFGELLPSAHAVDREFRVQAALFAQGFPVAQPYGLCEDRDVIGSMFYVMGLADGRSLWNGALPGSTPNERRAIYNEMTDTLAAMHRLRPQEIGLEGYGRPDAYCERQIARWTKQYRLSETGTIAEMDRLIDWLPRTIPAQTASAIAHGDYRLDNLILAHDEPRIIAVLDWELSTLGDPIADFTNYLMNWVLEADGRAPIGGLDHAALGIPTVAETIARYEEKSGLTVPNPDWYLAYNLFRFTAIFQGIKKRMEGGNASSAQAVEMVRKIPAMAAKAWEMAQKAGA